MPETNISGEFLKTNNVDCNKTLEDSGFNVRAIVSDDHSSKVSAYDLLLKDSGQAKDSLYMKHGDRKIYLLHDTVHLNKSVRNNNLLN